MAPEYTPRNWPGSGRGVLEDVTDAVTGTGLWAMARRALGRFLAPALPQGRVSLRLDKGQVVSLDGPGMARVRCARGAAWVTRPGDGRDVALRSGQDACMDGGGEVVVTAMEPDTRIQLGWR